VRFPPLHRFSQHGPSQLTFTFTNRWVYSNQSSKKQNQGHATYAPTSSATLLQNYTWEIRYSSSTGASGIVYRDDVKLGTVVAEGQAVEAATNIPFAFGPDGIMGLGSGKINQVKPEKQKTFFETVAPTLQRKLFAAAFVADGPGAWDFGYLNESRYSGDVVYTPNVQPDKYWTMAVGRYAVGDSTLGHKSIGHAIVDSGSTNVNLPEAIVKHYYSQVPTAKPIPGSGDTDYYFPCNTTLPDFHFQVENTTFTLTGDMINDSVFYADQCIGLLHTNTQTKHTILGNTFMKHFYVVFSAEDDSLKLGLAVRSDQK
jgi:aspergillopepsin I